LTGDDQSVSSPSTSRGTPSRFWSYGSWATAYTHAVHNAVPRKDEGFSWVGTAPYGPRRAGLRERHPRGDPRSGAGMLEDVTRAEREAYDLEGRRRKVRAVVERVAVRSAGSSAVLAPASTLQISP
jgi:hypothetical protein